MMTVDHMEVMDNTVSVEGRNLALEAFVNSALETKLSMLQSTLEERILAVSKTCLNQESKIIKLGMQLEDGFEVLRKILVDVSRPVQVSSVNKVQSSQPSICLHCRNEIKNDEVPPVKFSTRSESNVENCIGYRVNSKQTPVENALDQIAANAHTLAPVATDQHLYAAKHVLHQRMMGRALETWRRNTRLHSPQICQRTADDDLDDQSSHSIELELSSASDFENQSSTPCRRKSFADLLKCKRMFDADSDDESDAAASQATASDSDPGPRRNLFQRAAAGCLGLRVLEAVFGISGPNVWLGHEGSKAIHPNSPFVAG